MRRFRTRVGALALAVAVGSLVALPASARPVAGDGLDPGPVTRTLRPLPARVHPAPFPATIAIDPGHSGRTIRRTTVHGMADVDYPNYPEIYEMWDVSACAASALRRDGYRVVLTKRSALSTVSLTERARIVDRSHAALAVSVHDDHSQGATFQAVYSQRGVASHGRYPTMYRGRGSHRTTFARPAVARTSERYARAIARARAAAQHRPVRIAQNDFGGRAPLEPGNLAMVQLLSRTPWVYNELGARTRNSDTRAISVAAEHAYALGLVRGIEAAVPRVPGRANPPSVGVAGLRGCLQSRLAERPARYRP